MSEANGQQPQFEIQKLYLKDASLETPNSPFVFTQQWQPEISLQLATQTSQVADDLHEVVLRLTVTAKLGDKTAYLVEVQQAGLFTLLNFPTEQMGPMLGAYCPNILFAYAREAVDNLVAKGGFPALALKPVNFDALYLQHLQAQQVQA
ncbi:MAG TPA: protein-export chaperone SecB [Candidatus Competibacteraceae bacterium]|nr:protein-export chaperone SecB [Candidatus Competibacteraceae bacterium]